MEKFKVLVADDEEMLQDLFEMILVGEFDCEIVKVANGLSAIDALKKTNDFSLIISDYHMPGAKGDKVYIFNKANQNIPFFLFSGGSLIDYPEFNDLKVINKLNNFFNKPFTTEDFIKAVREIITTQEEKTIYLKADLPHFRKYSASPAEIYLKLSDNKYSKIVQINEDFKTRDELLNHYLEKGITDIYIERKHFNQLLQDTFKRCNQIIVHNPRPKTAYQLAGFNFLVCIEGLIDIGISENQIDKTHNTIEYTINTFLSSSSSREYLQKLCKDENALFAHSLLIMYVAAKICLNTSRDFHSTMIPICGAAFFHDFGLKESDCTTNYTKPGEINDPEVRKRILRHPTLTSEFLTRDNDVVIEIKKIILEHHELPDGSGYPRQLSAKQISPISCLFIIAEQISHCLLKSNFSKAALQDFFKSSELNFNQGHFSPFLHSARQSFDT